MLGDGHHVKFFACNEVNLEISNSITHNNIKSEDVLQWAINNSIKMIKNGSIYWAHQGLSYYLKKASYENYIGQNESIDLEKYFNTCIESNSTKLALLYGNSRKEYLITEIIEKQSNRLLRIFQESKMNSNEFEMNTKDNENYINEL